MSAAGLITIDPHPNVAKNRRVLTAKGVMEVIPTSRLTSKSVIYPYDRSTFRKNVCHNRLFSFGKPYAVPLLQHIKNCKEERGKDGNKTIDSKFAKAKPTDTVGAMRDIQAGSQQKVANGAIQELRMH